MPWWGQRGAVAMQILHNDICAATRACLQTHPRHSSCIAPRSVQLKQCESYNLRVALYFGVWASRSCQCRTFLGSVPIPLPKGTRGPSPAELQQARCPYPGDAVGSGHGGRRGETPPDVPRSPVLPAKGSQQRFARGRFTSSAQPHFSGRAPSRNLQQTQQQAPSHARLPPEVQANALDFILQKVKSSLLLPPRLLGAACLQPPCPSPYISSETPTWDFF